MSENEKILFVCVATGAFYNKAELYINKLHSMLSRHVKNDFSLICITDKKREINNAITQIDCSNWNELKAQGMRATTTKIGLFNPKYMPFEYFIYLDLTIIIKSDMAPLLDFIKSKNEPLIIIKDWFHETYNSSVMRIKPNELQVIYNDFISGVRYNQKTKGDQEFIYNTIAKHGIKNKVAIFPENLITSFKLTIRKSIKSKALANRIIEDAIIVKFHGAPKVHEFMNPIYRFLKYSLGNIRYRKIGIQIKTQQLLDNWK